MCLPQVRSDREKFTVYLDVKHFSPDELTVKVTDDYVEIQGKHGERQVLLLSAVRKLHALRSLFLAALLSKSIMSISNKISNSLCEGFLCTAVSG